MKNQLKIFKKFVLVKELAQFYISERIFTMKLIIQRFGFSYTDIQLDLITSLYESISL